jgi:hypothetical protein
MDRTGVKIKVLGFLSRDDFTVAAIRTKMIFWPHEAQFQKAAKIIGGLWLIAGAV